MTLCEVLRTPINDKSVGPLSLAMSSQEVDDWLAVATREFTVIKFEDIVRYIFPNALILDVNSHSSVVERICLLRDYHGAIFPGVKIGSTIADLKSACRNRTFVYDDEYFYEKGKHLAMKVDENPVFVPESRLQILCAELTSVAN